MTLEVQNLHVRTEEREILHGVDLVVRRGETHALMGPNGSGKSTLANTLMGNPSYEVTEGRILLNGEDLTEADPDERARAGLFMAFQYPATIPGVSVANFLRMAVNAKREEPIKVKEFGALLKENMDLLRIDRAFTSRYLNEGFSGGEKKRAEILHGVDLVVKKGETHALMGPNGSGKSTLANTLMGNPNYEVTEGRIRLNGEDLTEADPDERARAGLFMAFQYPATIPGVSVANFLRMAVNAGREEPIKVKEFGAMLKENMDLLKIDRAFTSRYLNEGFSGGEKKRAEILQLAMLRPEIAVLDETDSGLDIDALRIVSEGVNAMRGDERGFLIITHYTRILNYVKPDFVHIMLDGRIVREGGSELATELEEKGYEFVREEVAASGA